MDAREYQKLASRTLIDAPGSDGAIAKGCRCARMDNAYGKGYMGGVRDGEGNIVYVINGNCPLHGEAAVARAVARGTLGGNDGNDGSK